jgi:hypothetical protein
LSFVQELVFESLEGWDPVTAENARKAAAAREEQQLQVGESVPRKWARPGI